MFSADEARIEYEAGATLRQLCAKYGFNSTSHMARLLRDAGCELRPRARRLRTEDDPLVRRAKSMRSQGKTLGQIADALGLKSRSTAHKYLGRVDA